MLDFRVLLERPSCDPKNGGGATRAFVFTLSPAGDDGGFRRPPASVLPSGSFLLAGTGA